MEWTNPMNDASANAMTCMQIWGGHESAEESISVHGLDVFVVSRPYADATAGGDVYFLST